MLPILADAESPRKKRSFRLAVWAGVPQDWPDRTEREARQMRAESVAKSILMLKGILDGKTYTLVAQESGLSRSAVEQRVKALARDLQTVVGVEWVDADEVPTLQGLRARRENYLEALEHYHPQRAVKAAKGPRALTDQDIDRAAAVIRQHSNCRKRDTALLLVLFSTAAKPLEIARLLALASQI